MNKKKGGKKGKMVPLDYTGGAGDGAKQAEPIKTSDKDINHKVPAATISKVQSVPQVEVNKNEEEISKFTNSIEFQVPSIYYALDNKLIDTYYANRVDIFSEDEKDLL